MDGWITVIPGIEGAPETARVLIALAEDPTHVRTGGNGSEFLVPPYLAELYTTPPKPRRRSKKDEEES